LKKEKGGLEVEAKEEPKKRKSFKAESKEERLTKGGALKLE